MLELVLYGRPACHLCDEMVEELETALARIPYRLKIEDVDSNPAWRERYGLRIPVLTREDGREICHYQLDSAAVRSLVTR